MAEGFLDIYGEPIRYEFVEKPCIRNSYIRFVDDKLLVVSSSQRRMNGLVEKHKSWIFKHYKQIKSSIRMYDSKAVTYLGTKYPVAFRESSRPRVELNPGVIIVNSRKSSADRYLKNWIKAQTLYHTVAIANQKAERLGKGVREIKARRLRKWGMCSSNKRITFNACLSMLPESIIDYVVSHEVSHLAHLNHSKEFWETVGSLCPDYRQLRKELAKYDNTERQVLS
ncbi:MAG: DUF45 domain-containing protein [Candidatus Micrarchaeota archaeon]|nr:DUF45 domain-containing protein [Candidatus Micrarchaeota archaeon]